MVEGGTHIIGQVTESVCRTNVVKRSPFNCPKTDEEESQQNSHLSLVGVCRWARSGVKRGGGSILSEIRKESVWKGWIKFIKADIESSQMLWCVWTCSSSHSVNEEGGRKSSQTRSAWTTLDPEQIKCLYGTVGGWEGQERRLEPAQSSILIRVLRRNRANGVQICVERCLL